MTKYFNFVKWIFNLKNSDPFNVALFALMSFSAIVMIFTEIQYGLFVQIGGFLLLLLAQLFSSLYNQYQREVKESK